MDIISGMSSYAIPTIILVILALGMYKEVKVYDVFAEGAKEGISTVIRIIPALVGLMVAIGVFRASGALDLIVFAVKPITSFLKIPSEVVPLAFLRPISGSASLALVSDILKTYGADSFIGRLASTLMGSTETIFYTLAVYFGSVGIKNIRFTLVAALVADLVSVIAAVWICSLVFGG
jgi:spore maturation protein B